MRVLADASAVGAGGRDGFRHTVEFVHSGFPDLGFVIEDMVAEHWACRDDIGGFRQLGIHPRSA